MTSMLIVEDDASVRAFTARAFQMAGFAIETAEDGADGLERIRRTGGRYDLVLSDIRMPAMDGIEMAIAASAEFPGLRIVLMTGYAEQVERANELDVILDVVSKPFTLREIRNRVSAALAIARRAA